MLNAYLTDSLTDFTRIKKDAILNISPHFDNIRCSDT